jgi:hypothetical protein
MWTDFNFRDSHSADFVNVRSRVASKVIRVLIQIQFSMNVRMLQREAGKRFRHKILLSVPLIINKDLVRSRVV